LVGKVHFAPACVDHVWTRGVVAGP